MSQNVIRIPSSQATATADQPDGATPACIDGRIGEPASWLVRPPAAITWQATKVHGITNQEVTDLPGFDAVAADIRAQRLRRQARRLGPHHPRHRGARRAQIRRPARLRRHSTPWCVERTLAWLTAHRRLARDHERDPATSEAMIRWAAINTVTSRIARGEPATRQQRWHWPDE